ncbi:MAG: flagellar biosynthesis protein FlhB [Deltaproteobacteria bacterium]|nr:flagellar biosynthesis protein FlhB [Deltaproteobacteria bacterium]
MALDDDKTERTEPGTSRRREEARKKGQVAKSREITTTAVLFTSLVILYFYSQYMLNSLAEIMSRFLYNSGTYNLTQESLMSLIMDVGKGILITIAPMIIAIPIVGIISNVLQTGWLVSTETMSPKFSKLNPLEGAKKLVSVSALAEFVKSLLKLAIVAYVAYVTLRAEVANVPLLIDTDTNGILIYLGKISFKVLLRSCWVLLVLAAIDYAFQRWEYEKSLRMTKQEIRDEMKDIDGNPMIKSRIKSVQRELARKRMMREVPKADVVITNPTHFAVALKYDSKEMAAPIVVAKGQGLIAQKIKEIAKENRVPIVEDKPLARTLYKLVDIGRPIPDKLYKAVAEILAYVYKLRKKAA